MAAGDRIFMAKESTSQEILSNTKKIIEDAKAKPKRYGMRINLLDSNPATRVKYLYDAVGMTPAGMNFAGGGFDYGDWGDIWFVKKNRPVMVRTDGTVDYELNHENHALKLNGGASDITKTSYGGNAMSEIPLIWVKRWTQNNYHFVVFCEEQYDDTYKAYAHTDADGNVLPVTYFPMYEGSVVNNRMRSLSGLTPTASMTDEQETTAAKQNGDRWDKQSFSEINLMYEMCTMITCSTNSQGKFGNGNSQSDNFLQTGTLNGKGQFFGYTSTTQAVKVFYCENFFANYWKRLRGLLLINGVYHVKAVPPYNSTGAGYTNTGLTPSGTSGGYCSRMEMASDIGRIPTVASGSETTYECDGLWFNNTIVEMEIFPSQRDESEIIHSGEYTRLENTIAAAREALQIAQDTQNTIDAAEAVRQAQERLREAAEKAREIKESRREDDTAKAIAKCVEAMEAAIEQTKKCLTATEEANKIIISQSGLDAILAAVKDYYERIRELETDININVDGGTPKSTDLLLVKGGTPFTTDYDKYIAGTSHTI